VRSAWGTKLTAEQESGLREIRSRLDSKRPSLLDIFQFGSELSGAAQRHNTGAPIQRVAILGGSVTTDYLCHAITCALAQEDVLAVLYQAPFGSYVQEILDTNSGLYRFQPEIVVLTVDWRDIGFDELPFDAPLEKIESALVGKVNDFERLWTALERQLRSGIVQHTLVPPLNRFRGIADRISDASIYNQVRLLNSQLFRAGSGRVHWVDMESLACRIGLQSWSADRYYYSGKFGFDQRLLPHYLEIFRGAWRAMSGRAKKVLVLDLDNTLWGGVIGDDGLDGISLGPDSAIGEAYQDWQRYLKALRHRGVILAVCSKNSPEIGLSGLLHPHSVLKNGDFAAIECSWNDKAQGLSRIARSLNLGLDSFVFADDNPAECDLIRRSLPEVTVVHLGSDPGFFVERLDTGCWFDLQRYTAEDFGRSDAYASRLAAINEQLPNATDIGGYLTSLEMVGRLYEPPESDIVRVAQLEQKTNQFNLTTRRYSETAVRDFLKRKDVIVLAFRLADRFGDHGLVSTIIAFEEENTLTIDSWTMSCRILSRSAEQYIMRELIELAKERSITRIKGVYEPTKRNEVVADLYVRLGFSASPYCNVWFRSVSQKPNDLMTYIRNYPSAKGKTGALHSGRS